MNIKSVVIPVAGMGTRFLPATKSIPKEMLPVLDKPLLHYAIEEAKGAGIKKFIFVTNPNNKFPKLYLSENKTLEKYLRLKKKNKILKQIKDITLKDNNVKLVYQKKPLGLGDAIYQAKKYIDKEDFAVVLPDDLILGKNCLQELIKVYKNNKSSVIGVMNVQPHEVEKYGIIKGVIKKTKKSKVKELVEKPKAKNAPSTLAVVGRYILKNSIFEYLGKVSKGAGDEIQLTDALTISAKHENVFSYKFSGQRYDCGSKLGFLKAQIACALSDSSINKSIKAELLALLKKGINK